MILSKSNEIHIGLLAAMPQELGNILENLREIEEHLVSQPNISSACVVGKQDKRSGETPIAFITLKSQIDLSTLRKYCEETLLPYKIPSEFIVIKNLPLTPAKKVDKLALKKMLN